MKSFFNKMVNNEIKNDYHYTSSVDSVRFTVDGFINKMIVMMIALFSAGSVGFAFSKYVSESVSLILMIAISLSMIGYVWIFYRKKSSITVSLIYAVLEGFTLGIFSNLITRISGVDQSQAISYAVIGVAVTVSACLIVYKQKWFKVTQKFRAIAAISMMGVLILYIVSLALSFILGPEWGFTYKSNIFSVIVIIIAAMNLQVDFDDVRLAEENGIPDDQVGWKLAMGMTITIVLIYVEILKIVVRSMARR